MALLAMAVGVLVTLTAAESVLRLLPVQNGIFAADPAPDWQVHHLVPRSHYTFSDAWNLRNVRHGTTNDMGYAAPFDYVPGTSAVVVVGDSFVEGLMNWYADTLQGQLARQLTASPPILNFGTATSANGL